MRGRFVRLERDDRARVPASRRSASAGRVRLRGAEKRRHGNPRRLVDVVEVAEPGAGRSRAAAGVRGRRARSERARSIRRGTRVAVAEGAWFAPGNLGRAAADACLQVGTIQRATRGRPPGEDGCDRARGRRPSRPVRHRQRLPRHRHPRLHRRRAGHRRAGGRVAGDMQGQSQSAGALWHEVRAVHHDHADAPCDDRLLRVALLAFPILPIRGGPSRLITTAVRSIRSSRRPLVAGSRCAPGIAVANRTPPRARQAPSTDQGGGSRSARRFGRGWPVPAPHGGIERRDPGTRDRRRQRVQRDLDRSRPAGDRRPADDDRIRPRTRAPPGRQHPAGRPLRHRACRARRRLQGNPEA